MTIDRNRLRAVIKRLYARGTEAVPATIDALHTLGAVRNAHVSVEPGAEKLSGEQVVEWYAGQALDVLEGEHWFAVNTLCNVLDLYVPLSSLDQETRS